MFQIRSKFTALFPTNRKLLFSMYESIFDWYIKVSKKKIKTKIIYDYNLKYLFD